MHLEEIALKQGSWFTGGQQVLIAWKRLFCGSPIFYESMLYMKCRHNHILEGRTCDKKTGKYGIIQEPGVHFSLDMLLSWADRGSCAHKCVYVKFFRTVTRIAVNKSVWRKKDCSLLPLYKHAMNIWLSSLRIRAHLRWRTGKHLHVLHVLRTYSTCSYPGY